MTAVFLPLVLAEVLVQLSGVLDFPVYKADNQIGYIPAPGQSGKFLNSREWQFNEYSMGAGTFKPDSSRFNVLLVGDSIVLGGNPLAQSERLGAQLEKFTGWQVWPVSAGSWALQNELSYLRSHPEILDQVDAVTFVWNSGDFEGPSSWASELSHPLKRPFPGLLYVVRKYGFPSVQPPQGRAKLKVRPRDWGADLYDFSRTFKKPIFVFMYPNLDELQHPAKMKDQLDSRIPYLQARLNKNAQISRVADSLDWNAGHYRDSIHPGSQGNSALATIIISSMCKTKIDKMTCTGFDKVLMPRQMMPTSACQSSLANNFYF